MQLHKIPAFMHRMRTIDESLDGAKFMTLKSIATQ